MSRDYETHKYAEMFPDMTGDEFDELVKDIGINGLIEPITMMDGKVLDGRSRLRACIQAGVEPVFVEFDGRQDPLMFVWAKNFARRHLATRQRVTLVLRFKDMVEAAAKERMSKGGKISAAIKSGQGVTKVVTLEEGEKGRTVDKLAEMANVSRGTMQGGRFVERDGRGLLDDMKGGKRCVGKAAKKAKAKNLHKTTDKPGSEWKKVVKGAEKLNADLSAFQLSSGMVAIKDIAVLQAVADRLFDFLKTFDKGDGK